jgi:hypothetical protein
MEKKKTRPGLPGKIYFLGQLVFNTGGVVFATLTLAWIFFINFGNGAGTLAWVQGFVFVMVFFFTVIQGWGALVNTRRDYLRAKWVAGAPPQTPSPYVGNPWRLLLPLGLAAGFIAAAAALCVPLLGSEPFSLLNISLVAGVPLFVASTIIIMIFLPRDQSAFAAALPALRLPAAPPGQYLWLEHVLPWLPIQGLINLSVGLKQFGHEAEKLGSSVPIKTIALDAGFVFPLIVFICWFSAQVQVRPDVHLGRVAQDPGRAQPGRAGFPGPRPGGPDQGPRGHGRGHPGLLPGSLVGTEEEKRPDPGKSRVKLSSRGPTLHRGPALKPFHPKVRRNPYANICN